MPGANAHARPSAADRVAVCLAAAVCLIVASAASAEEAAPRLVEAGQFPLTHVLVFLFLMLGPFKIIAPFSRIARGADAELGRQIALRATVAASLALLVAGLLGDMILGRYGIPLPVLALSAGIILCLVALQSILQQFAPAPSQGEEGPALDEARMLQMAITPLAFPTIVTPYGVAAFVVFLALSPDLQHRLMIGAIVLAIMSLNLVSMLLARHVLPIVGMLLAILGAVLGVVQVALGLQIIGNSLRAMGILQ